jgi:hypothetical protein
MNRIRLVAGVIGLAAALYGVLQQDRRMVWIAIVALIISMTIRIWGRRRPR